MDRAYANYFEGGMQFMGLPAKPYNKRKLFFGGRALTAFALIIILIPCAFVGSVRLRKADNASVRYYLNPYIGEYVSAKWKNNDNSILGSVSGQRFIPSETKTLTLTADFQDGFSYCHEYSSFFNQDEAALAVCVNDEGSFEFTYAFTRDAPVLLSALENIYILASANSLPKLNIDISVPLSMVTREKWVEADVTITSGSKQFSCGEYAGKGKIKGRGNTSWEHDKKPYSINIFSKASLLDISSGPTEKYAVVSSGTDSSMLRNYITYRSAAELIGIDYIPGCEFVDLYFNGQYAGVYLLVERIEVDKEKVAIREANRYNPTGGFLIEKDLRSRTDLDNDLWFDSPFHTNYHADSFTLISPEPQNEEFAADCLAYLEQYMLDLHNAIMLVDGDDYKNYVDFDSWIDFLIIQELSKNIDGNLKTSCYFYKLANDDKLYFASLWDFDRAYGNCSYSNANIFNDCYDCPLGENAFDFMVINSSCPWYDTLYHEYPEFYYAVRDRYEFYREGFIEALSPLVLESAAYISNSAKKNDMIWSNDSYTGAVALRAWIDARIQWLDSQWLEQESAAPVRRANVPALAILFVGVVNLYNALWFAYLYSTLGKLRHSADSDSDEELSGYAPMA